ncbi:MAG: magnesium chelatase [Bacteroidia bacterium]
MFVSEGMQEINTLKKLKQTNYQSLTIKDEMRKNLIRFLGSGQNPFEGIYGYEDTVLPQLKTAILSRHNIILLGLRGQAKTRIARLMVNLLDEYIPVVEGSEINDDPLNPISSYAKNLIEKYGDDTPISWLHRDERFAEKLATPDVSIADLIGDIDPIKAANLKLHYNDERVLHYGLIPRSHRCIFVINELPDLQARIQVALFNILQEGDIQIRGFKLRLPLDVAFVFTANPEDYTNRGSIVTPLKDRIDSQILTHYPKTIEVAKSITLNEANITDEQRNNITVDDILLELIEQIAFEARQSDLIDQKSGVSARLTISALENLYSSAEIRMLQCGELKTYARISDLFGVLPSITGKVELVYEGELEGASNVAYNLIDKAIRTVFTRYFPNPDKMKKVKELSDYYHVINWFNDGNEIAILNNASQKVYEKNLNSVNSLADVIDRNYVDKKINKAKKLLLMEFVLHGLASYSSIGKKSISAGFEFKDLMSGMFSKKNIDD